MSVPSLAGRAPAGSGGGVGGRAGVAASSVPGRRRTVESLGTPAVPARGAPGEPRGNRVGACGRGVRGVTLAARPRLGGAAG